MQSNLANLFAFPAFMRGNQPGPAMAGPNPGGHSGHGHESPDTLSPRPVPEDLCELRAIVLQIFHAADQSQYISRQVKDTLRGCAHHLEAECEEFVNLQHLAYRATEESKKVLHSRIDFFEVLGDHIKALSHLRSKFVESRESFRARPTNLLLEGIREARGHTYDGMLSGLRPLFERIETCYNETNVALLKEEERLKAIYNSLLVTPGDELRWEDIRDACREAYTLLTPDVPPLHPSPHMPQQTQQTNNKAARYIRVLAQTVIDARQSLLQSRMNIANLTQKPQFSLLRLEGEYRHSEDRCRQRIDEVHQFSEQFLDSIVKVPPLDEFRDHVVPSAAASSAQNIRAVRRQVQSIQYVVVGVLPQLEGHFLHFERCFPIADASMQRLYGILQRLVRPLEQPNDPHQGVLRAMRPRQLRDEHDRYSGLVEKWAAVQTQPSHGGPYPFS